MQIKFLLSLIFLLNSCGGWKEIASSKNSAGKKTTANVVLDYTGATSLQLDNPIVTQKPNSMASGMRWINGLSLNDGRYITLSEYYDPQLDSWTELLSPDTNLWRVRLVKLSDGRVLEVGSSGYSIFDPQTNLWSSETPMSPSRSASHLHLLPNGKVAAVAGKSNNSDTNSIDIFDPNLSTWTNVSSASVSGDSTSTLLLRNGDILISGGWDTQLRSTTETYNYLTNTLTAKGNLNKAREYHQMIELDNGKVLLVGGDNQDAAQMTEICELYSPETGQWTITDSLNSRRSYGAIGKLRDGRVMYAGGFSNFNPGDKSKDIEIYDPNTSTWSSQMAQLPVGLADFPSLFELENGDIFVVGGWSETLKQDIVLHGINFTKSVNLSASGGDGIYTYSILRGPGRISGDKFYVGVAGVTQIEVTDGSGASSTFSIAISGP